MTGCGDGHIRFWDMVGGHIVRMIQAHTPHGVLSMYLEPGNLLLSGSTSDEIKSWSIRTFKCTKRISSDLEAVWAVHCDDKYIAGGCEDSSVRIFEKQSGKFQQRLQGHTRAVRCVNLDGKYLYTGGEDGRVCVWVRVDDTQTSASQAMTRTLSLQDGETDVFSDQQEGDIRSSRKEMNTPFMMLHSFLKHDCVVRGLSTLGVGMFLISASADGVIYIWNIEEGRLVREEVCQGRSFQCISNENGVLLAGSNSGTILKWLVACPPPSNE